MTRGWHRPGHPIGTRFQQLTVVGARYTRIGTGGIKVYYYPCRCECGARTDVSSGCLGRTQSCGCVRTRKLAECRWRHGESDTRLYYVWYTMRQRCMRRNRRDSHRYSLRGITVCETWARDYVPFRDWALAHGYGPGLQLDRIDNNGHYTPDNCRWVTNQRNSCNRAGNVRIDAFGETKCLAEWVRDPRCSVAGETILYRMRRCGWTAEAAITTARKTVGRWAHRHDTNTDHTPEEEIHVTHR
jgi:hypothetical protein